MDETESDVFDKNNEWVQNTWKPAVGVTYIIINVFDFIIFPILWTVYAMVTGTQVTQWHPLTLDSTGLFHLSFGAILGVSAWSKGRDRAIDYTQFENRYGRDRMNIDRDYRESSSTYRGER